MSYSKQNDKKNKGLVESLVDSFDNVASDIVYAARTPIRQAAKARSNTKVQKQSQAGGATGDGYGWHRRNALNNLGQQGINGRDAWLDEVRAVQAQNPGMIWSDALRAASLARRANRPNYKSVKERVVSGYTGRTAAAVDCPPGKPCPGAYNKPAPTTYRPGKRLHRPLSEAAAVKALREHYRSLGHSGTMKSMKSATSGMRRDISLKRKTQPLTACGTRTITVKKPNGGTGTRRIAVKTPECADSWLYRSAPRRHDLVGVDYGEGKDSPAYGKRKLYKKRKDAGTSR